MSMFGYNPVHVTREKLEQENARMRAQLLAKDSLISVKDTELDAKKSLLESKDAFIDQLKEALFLERNRLFAKATESLRSLQNELFDEPELESKEADSLDQANDDAIEIPAHKCKRGGRKKLPDDLPRIDVIHDLSDSNKVCPHDGHALKEIGAKASEQLDIIPMQI